MKWFGRPKAKMSESNATDDQIKLIEAQTSAKEVASKYIGRSAIPWIVLLVAMGVFSAAILPVEALPAVIGLVSTATMALIGILTGITGTKEKEEKPEFKVINSLIERLDRHEPMRVDVDAGKVIVSKGEDTVALIKTQQQDK